MRTACAVVRHAGRTAPPPVTAQAGQAGQPRAPGRGQRRPGGGGMSSSMQLRAEPGAQRHHGGHAGRMAMISSTVDLSDPPRRGLASGSARGGAGMAWSVHAIPETVPDGGCMVQDAHRAVRRCRVGQVREPSISLPRHGVGREGDRRPHAVRDADPGRRPGGAELGDDPAQARRLPRRLCRLRSARGGRFRRGGVAALLADPAIVRHRGKIAATVANARAFLAVQHSHGSFAAYLWAFVDATPVVNRPPTASRCRRAPRCRTPSARICAPAASASSAAPSSMRSCRRPAWLMTIRPHASAHLPPDAHRRLAGHLLSPYRHECVRCAFFGV